MTKSIFNRRYFTRDLFGKSSHLALWYLGILKEEVPGQYLQNDHGDDNDDDTSPELTIPPEIIDDVTLLPTDYEFQEWRERDSWQHAAWRDGPLGKIAVRLASGCYIDDSAADTPEAWIEAEANARKHIGDLIRWIIVRATEDEIADALAQVAEALGQEITREAAQCMVPMIARTGMPLMAVHEMCRRVAETETGKLKPASFAKLIAETRRRHWEFERVRDLVGELVVHFDRAMAYIAAAIAEEKARPELETTNVAD